MIAYTGPTVSYLKKEVIQTDHTIVNVTITTRAEISCLCSRTQGIRVRNSQYKSKTTGKQTTSIAR